MLSYVETVLQNDIFSCCSTEPVGWNPQSSRPQSFSCPAQPVQPPPYCALPPPYTPQFTSCPPQGQSQIQIQPQGEDQQCQQRQFPPPEYTVQGQGESQDHQGQDKCQEQPPPGYETEQEQCPICRRLRIRCICPSPNCEENEEEIEAVHNQDPDFPGDDDSSSTHEALPASENPEHAQSPHEDSE